MTTTIKDLGELELLNRLKKFIRCGQIDDDVADTMEWLSDNLPSSQASTATPENYIFYSLVNAEGQQLASNE